MSSVALLNYEAIQIVMSQVHIQNNTVVIPSEGKKRFEPNVYLLDRHVKSCLDFAQAMAYGNGHHQALAFAGDNHRRSPSQIFRDTLQGKIAEFGIHTFLHRKGVKVDEFPSCEVWGEGEWEDCDFTLNNGVVSVSVKSTKHFGNLLLLECHRYNQEGLYLEPSQGTQPIKHDYVFLVRVKGVTHSSVTAYNTSSAIKCEVTGFITHMDFCELINRSQIIRKGVKIGIPMIVDNYYVCANDLHKADGFVNFVC